MEYTMFLLLFSIAILGLLWIWYLGYKDKQAKKWEARKKEKLEAYQRQEAARVAQRRRERERDAMRAFVEAKKIAQAPKPVKSPQEARKALYTHPMVVREKSYGEEYRRRDDSTDVLVGAAFGALVGHMLSSSNNDRPADPPASCRADDYSPIVSGGGGDFGGGGAESSWDSSSSSSSD